MMYESGSRAAPSDSRSRRASSSTPFRFRDLDMYTKLDDSFRDRTSTGATLSIIGWVFIVILILGELSSYFTPAVREHMVVDSTLGQQLRINVNITFHALGCSQVHMDTMDIAGDNQLNVEHDMQKQSLNLEGKPIGDPTRAQLLNRAKGTEPCLSCFGAESESRKCCNTCDDLRKAYEEKGWNVASVLLNATQCLTDAKNPLVTVNLHEGCRISGSMKVNKVSGNFHIAHGESVVRDGRHIHQFNPLDAHNFNISHTIHSISFGDPYPKMPANPLDTRSRLVTEQTGLSQYFIKIIPTIYTDSNGNKLHTNRYTATERFRPFVLPEPGKEGAAVLPGVFFVYDLSPFMIEVSEARPPLSHIITRLFAIVGGTFTVLGAIDTVLYKLTKKNT